MPTATVDAFAIAAPGLEQIVAAELCRLGLPASAESGGASWTGGPESVMLANLWLRAGSRVVVRVGEFRARTFWELERHARKLPWERFIPSGASIRFRVTSRKSRLYHTNAIGQRLAVAAANRAGAAVPTDGVAPAGTDDDADGYDDDDREGQQLFVVRVLRDVCTVSADSSGALLHRRGYRRAVAKAPLRETLAAAMLIACDWPGDAPLIDPMCGSGTIPIEAALMARRIAPGLNRPFSFQRWPRFDSESWDRMVTRAREQELPALAAVLGGSDRDAGAVEAARANAERAGVSADITFEQRVITGIEPPRRAGWVVVNPPYGVRVAEAGAVRDLYAAFGNVLRARFAGWRVGMLSAGEQLDRQTGLQFRERFATVNGGIPVRLVTGEVPR